MATFKHLFILGTILTSVSGCSTLTSTQKPAEVTTSAADSSPLYSIDDNILPPQNTKVDQATTKPRKPIQKISSSQGETLHYDNLWAYVQSKLQFSTIEHERIEKEKQWYLANSNYLPIVSQRATPYLHYIVSELERHNLPLDFALLPIVESAFNPKAYSPANASGLWQFIPMTAEDFNLPMDWWYDARRDVIRSTQAAIEYLTYLNQRFNGDWPQAIAAYNAGGGAISRAIRKNEELNLDTSYWNLDVPAETAAYVPKLIALSQILAESELTEEQWTLIPNQPYLSIITLKHQMDISLAAELAQIDSKELYQLNPGLNRWATPPYANYKLAIPAEKESVFKEALDNLKPEQMVTWQRYKVQSGDSLSVIAKRFACPVDIIKKTNQLTSSQIRIGHYLLIPTTEQGVEPSIAITSTNTSKKNNKPIAKTAPSKTQQHHIVQTGDTFWDIARHYNVSVAQLTKWNGLSSNSHLKPGQKLVLQSQKIAKSSQKTAERKVIYTVKSGDSLSKIAQRFNVKVSEILKWNRLIKNSVIKPGHKLKLFIIAAEEA